MSFENFATSPSSFGRKSSAIDPSDTEDLPRRVKAVVTLTAGDLAIIPYGDTIGSGIDPVEFVDVPAGFIPPYMVRRVMATGTTCEVRTVED